VGACDHGDQACWSCLPLDETRRPSSCAAGCVDDLFLGNCRIAHGWSPQGTGYSPERAGELEGLEEEGLAIGETIKEVADLVRAETVVDVAVLVEDHGFSLLGGFSTTKTLINPKI
jgi:hypothetical protein